MLVVDVATFKDFHFVQIVPDIECRSNFLPALLHDQNGVSMGIDDWISGRCINLTLQYSNIIALLTTTHLHDHKHILQVESMHVLVDHFGLLVCANYQ